MEKCNKLYWIKKIGGNNKGNVCLVTKSLQPKLQISNTGIIETLLAIFWSK
jgi:hypothetical protein